VVDEKVLENSNQEFAPRLRSIRGKLARVKFLQGLESSQNSLVRYERGERIPDANFVAAVCRKYRVRADWLLSGEGPMYIEDARPGEMFSEVEAVAHYPLISWVQAGHWQPVIDNYQPGDGEMMVPSSKCLGARTFCLRVHGDSMEPTVPEGSIIFVDPDVHADNGSLAVVRLDDEQEVTFKKIVQDGAKRYLTPVNPRYPVMEVKTPATICGVVRRIQPPMPLAIDLK